MYREGEGELVGNCDVFFSRDLTMVDYIGWHIIGPDGELCNDCYETKDAAIHAAKQYSAQYVAGIVGGMMS